MAIRLVIALAIAAIIGYFSMPTLNPWFAESYFAAAVLLLPFLFPPVLSIPKGRLLYMSPDDMLREARNAIKRESSARSAHVFAIFAFLGLLAVTFIVAPLASVEIGRSNRFYELLGPVQASNFTEDITPVESAFRLVDESMAEKLGAKRLGEVSGLGSRVVIGKFDVQRVKNELYWVAPLVHKGFMQYWNFGNDGTQGYLMVSVSNPDDVRLVQEFGNKQPVRIRYQPNAYFLQDLERHLYLNGFASIGTMDYTFEIDDEGKPYYVVTTYEHAIGFGAKNATGIAVVDVESGKIERYSIDQAPAWIDRVQPERLVHDQISWWGEYVKGWWNAAFVGDEVLRVSGHELRMVFSENGQAYWYSELTSKGKDNSMTAFLLTNTRTKETKRYNVAGATCKAAEGSAEGATQNMRYEASNFVLYNVGGKPTCVGPLKDQAGLIKGVAMVSVENYDIVGWGANTQDALRSYRGALASRGQSSSASDPVKQHAESRGTITRFGSDTKNGQTYYYFTIEGKSGYLFAGTSSNSAVLPISQKGDKVLIRYPDTGKGIVDIESFQNESIAIAESERDIRK